MILKRSYLRGAAVQKEHFRRLQIEGEDDLARSTNNAACELTQAMVPVMPALALRNKRTQNVKSFLNMIAGQETPFRPLFDSWPKGAAPFNAVLFCESSHVRDRLLAHLIANRVYAAVHWRLVSSDPFRPDRSLQRLSDRLLTIPVDHRLNAADLARVVGILLDFAR